MRADGGDDKNVFDLRDDIVRSDRRTGGGRRSAAIDADGTWCERFGSLIGSELKDRWPRSYERASSN